MNAEAAAGTWSFHPYAVPLRTPYRWARGEQRERRGLLVRLTAPDGVVGWGECAPPPHDVPSADALVADAQALVAGLDAASPRFLTALDARHPDPRLRAGLSTAWLDAHARADGEPLARALARRVGLPRGPAAEVPVNALVGAVPPDEAARLARAAAAAGHRTIKVKCAEDRALDVARVRAVREAAPGLALRLDANGAWDPAWALDHLADLAPFGVEYVEDPVEVPEGEVGARQAAAFRRASPVPVALDAPVTGPTAAQALVAAGAADVLVVKPQRVGGPDRAAHLLRFLEAAGVPAVVTNSLETAVGLTAALHCAALLPPPTPDCGLATAGLLAADVAVPPPVVAARMAVPQRPGLGLAEVDPDAPRAA